jgi:hypothetical protein
MGGAIGTQASPGGYYQTQAAPQYTGKYGNMAQQQAPQQAVPQSVAQQYQQPVQQAPQPQQQAQTMGYPTQPNYASMFNYLASMFGQPQYSAPSFNAPRYAYNPYQTAGNFQLRNSWNFNPASDPSRQVAARMQAKAEAAAAEEAKRQASLAAQYTGGSNDVNQLGGGAGDGAGAAGAGDGEARGGRIGDKHIRSALMVAKGVKAKAVPANAGIIHTVIDPTDIDHPAAQIPGIHVREGKA